MPTSQDDAVATTIKAHPTKSINEKSTTVAIATTSEQHDVESSKPSSARRLGSLITIFGSALANLSDGYQQNLASNTNVIYKHTLCSKTYTSAIQTRISNSLLVGSVLGILIFGYLADKFSRKGGMLLTSSLVVAGSLMATLAWQVDGVHAMLWYMTVARGAAGEYPTSAAAALESSHEAFDGKRGPVQVCISTLMATSGAPVCTLVYLLALIGSGDDLKVAFHAMYGISIFLPMLVMLVRWRMQDGSLTYWPRILGTSTAFFLYDFVNFPNSIMSATIINSLVPNSSIHHVALWQFYLALMPVPGVFLGAYLVNRIGRRWTGILGFTLGYILIGFIIGGLYHRLTTDSIAAFVVLYGLLQAFGHMGPGATIGLLSAEVFPTGVRGVGYGIAAGFGKAGAAIGTQVFTPIKEAAGPDSTFYLAGGVGVLASVVYYFLPEGQDLKLEVMDEEFERLVAGKQVR